MDHSLKAGTEISRGLSFCPVRLSSTSRCGSEQGILIPSHSPKYAPARKEGSNPLLRSCNDKALNSMGLLPLEASI